MNKYQALHSFFSSFGLTAYNENSVPTGDKTPAFPYLTYEVLVGDWETENTLTFSLWYRENTWENIYIKADEIKKCVEMMKIVNYDDGAIYIHGGSPIVQFTGEDSDDKIKRAFFNIEVNYIDLL